MKKLSLWQFSGFVFTSVFGVILHFLFNLTGQNVIIGAFSAVNESVWEHMKLLFCPMFVFALIESRYIGKDYISYWCVKLFGIVSGIVLIPVLYYTVNGAFGTTADWINIAIYFVAAAVVYIIETKLLKQKSLRCKSPSAALMILWLIAVVFVVLTFIPLHIPLFSDPLTGTYGI